MGEGSTPADQVLGLTEWPAQHLLKLQELFDTRAPELAVKLLVTYDDVRPGNYVLTWHKQGSFALTLATAPTWLTQVLARSFPVGYVLRVCATCDLVCLDSAYRLGGWEAMVPLLAPAQREGEHVVLSHDLEVATHVASYRFPHGPVGS